MRKIDVKSYNMKQLALGLLVEIGAVLILIVAGFMICLILAR